MHVFAVADISILGIAYTCLSSGDLITIFFIYAKLFYSYLMI